MWTVIYFVCSLQKYWIYYQKPKKMTKTLHCIKIWNIYWNFWNLILKCHIPLDIQYLSIYYYIYIYKFENWYSN